MNITVCLSDTELLSSCELFSSLLSDDIAYLASRTETRELSQGDTVFTKGEIAQRFFLVKSGMVSITAGTGHSKGSEIARYLTHDVFGDFHFVINGTYDATATALEPTQLLVFPADNLTFNRISDEKPDTAARILLKSLSMIASRLTTTRTLIEENKPWIKELRKQIYTDPPTGLWNKTFMDSELPQLIGGSVVIIMLKPDRFKELNDELGHVRGDEILAQIAHLLMHIAERLNGWAIRMRSNEMCLIVTGTTVSAAQRLTEKIQSSLPSIYTGLTASIGYTFWPRGNASLRQAGDAANARMMEIWKNGGNQVSHVTEAQ